MSTAVPQHKQNKSMFILLSILSLLVISTLVVASIYFLKPRVDTLNGEPKLLPQENGIKNRPEPAPSPITVQAESTRSKPKTLDTQEIVTTTNNLKPTETENLHQEAPSNLVDIVDKTTPSDSCDVHFSDNQLFVKNSDQ